MYDLICIGASWGGLHAVGSGAQLTYPRSSTSRSRSPSIATPTRRRDGSRSCCARRPNDPCSTWRTRCRSSRGTSTSRRPNYHLLGRARLLRAFRRRAHPVRAALDRRAVRNSCRRVRRRRDRDHPHRVRTRTGRTAWRRIKNAGGVAVIQDPAAQLAGRCPMRRSPRPWPTRSCRSRRSASSSTGCAWNVAPVREATEA